MVSYLHVTKHKGICACVLSEDERAKYELKKAVSKKYDNPYEMALECILKWQNEMIDKNIERVIIISDKRAIWQHIKHCENTTSAKVVENKMYDFERKYLGKFKIERYVGATVEYSMARKYCKEEYVEKDKNTLEQFDDIVDFM